MESLDELYGFARALSAELAESGRGEAAGNVRDSMRGSTSGEVLGQLWFALREVRAERPDDEAIAEALRYIESVLGPPRHPPA